MVQSSEVKQRQHGAVVMVSINLLVIVNATVEVSRLEASGVFLPVVLGVPLVPVAQSCVDHDDDPGTFLLLVCVLVSDVSCENADKILLPPEINKTRMLIAGFFFSCYLE